MSKETLNASKKSPNLVILKNETFRVQLQLSSVFNWGRFCILPTKTRLVTHNSHAKEMLYHIYYWLKQRGRTLKHPIWPKWMKGVVCSEWKCLTQFTPIKIFKFFMHFYSSFLFICCYCWFLIPDFSMLLWKCSPFLSKTALKWHGKNAVIRVWKPATV